MSPESHFLLHGENKQSEEKDILSLESKSLMLNNRVERSWYSVMSYVIEFAMVIDLGSDFVEFILWIKTNR